ncbi:hypothetical protein SLS62_009354 [Diatrype stigma]|uniref:Integral membrane protein n=1 Tax=Diatrype stigma TaxID=117547 RepID=A0AAN9UF40_9PEZI
MLVLGTDRKRKPHQPHQLPVRVVTSCILGFLLCYGATAAYLRSACYRDPSSIFFQPDLTRVLAYSSFRKAQAARYADQAAVLPPPTWANLTSAFTSASTSASTSWPAAAPNPDICVAIGSVSRNGFSYLKETVGSLLEGLDAIERQRVYLVVFLAHVNQSRHEEYGQPWLSNLADSLPTYSTLTDNPDTIRVISELEEDGGYDAHARKQKIDYSVQLTECARVNPSYIMTLEDDVIAMDGWYHRTMGALQSAAVKTEAMGRGRDGFLYLRIFYDGRLLGWNAEEWPSYIMASSSFLLVEALTVFLLRRCFVPVRKGLGRAMLVLIFGVCTPMVIGLFFAAGRNCMLPKKPGVHLMHKYGCCAQGYVFPQRQVTENVLPLYLDVQDSHAAVDTFIEDWANGHDGLKWAVTPVLIQHVGGKSTHGAGDQELGRLTDDMPFDYTFELNDPVQLAQEHQHAVLEINQGIGDE